MRRFHGKFQEAREERRERRDVPCPLHHIAAAEPENRQDAEQRHDAVERLHRIFEHARADGCRLVRCELRFIERVAPRFDATRAVKRFVPDAVHRRRSQRPFAFACRRTRPRHALFQPRRPEICQRQEHARAGREPHVIPCEHREIRDHHDARVKEFRREFPDAFCRCIDIRDGFRHQCARAFRAHARWFLVHERMIERRPHPAVDMVRETPHEEALARAAALHDDDDRDIEPRDARHVRCSARAAEDVRKALRELPLEIRPRRHADIVDEPRDRQERKQPRLPAQKGTNADRTRPSVHPLFFRFHAPSSFV